MREMLLDVPSERSLQPRGVDQIAAPLGGPDVIDEHVAHQQFALGPAHKVMAEFERDDLRKMLVLSAMARISSSVSSQNPRQSSKVSTAASFLNEHVLVNLQRAGAELVDHKATAGPLAL